MALERDQKKQTLKDMKRVKGIFNKYVKVLIFILNP